MAIEKKTIRDQIEITRSGHIQVRLALAVLEDGVEISLTYHRFVIAPGEDPDKWLAAVNADITTRPQLKAKPLEHAHHAFIKDVCRMVHTKEVVTSHKTAVAAAQAEFNKRMGLDEGGSA